MLHRVKKQNDLNKDKWIGIGGKFEEGESPEECIFREALEETGIELKGIFFGENKNLNINGLEAKNNVKNTDTALLYKIAKGFITFIRTR